MNSLLNTETLVLMEFNDICSSLIDLYHGKVYVTNDSILTLT